MTENDPAKALDPATMCAGLSLTIAALGMVRDRPFFAGWAPAAIAGLQSVFDAACGGRELFGKHTDVDQQDIRAFWDAAGCPCKD